MAGALTIILALTACGAVPRQLVGDSEVTIISPRNLATVSVPVHLRWRTSGGMPVGMRFAVFVDAYPLRPGTGLRSLVPSGDPCLTERGCPNGVWLRAHGVTLTSRDEVEITDLPPPGGIETQAQLPVHQVVIVLIDRSGHRVGDQAYSVEFRAAATGAGHL